MKVIKDPLRSRTLAKLIMVPAVILTMLATAQSSSAQWASQSHDAQHTGVSSVAAQSLKKIHWSTRVDLRPQLQNGELLIHYGSPLVTAANTVLVPVKTGVNRFGLQAHNGSDGSLLWKMPTDYSVPFSTFTPSFGPVLGSNKVYMPAGGGTVLVRENPDQPQGKVTRLIFYGKKNFGADPAAYQSAVQINTPLTVDSKGNLYFGFLISGTTPIGLQSGLARIAPDGTGMWTSASFASGDSNVTGVNMNCAPALSSDEGTVYVGVNSSSQGYGYLLALNSGTLNLTAEARLTDPASGLDAWITDESSATPTVGPDGDVYFGVLETPFPDHNDRGWLLHFSADLSQVKIPGSFGWDDTASIVPAKAVPSYHGASAYLLMTKYNNYAGVGGDGVNKIAILDPNATEADPVLGNPVMNEVLTVKGETPDPRFPNFPGAVREWCINTAAVDPSTKSVVANSEDGKLYRWDLKTNKLSEVITLTKGLGEAYTPTVIGTDGTVYAINDAILFAVGN